MTKLFKRVARLTKSLGVDPELLSPEHRKIILERAEFEGFLELLKSLRGNFIKARWRGRLITPKDVRYVRTDGNDESPAE